LCCRDPGSEVWVIRDHDVEVESPLTQPSIRDLSNRLHTLDRCSDDRDSRAWQTTEDLIPHPAAALRVIARQEDGAFAERIA